MINLSHITSYFDSVIKICYIYLFKIITSTSLNIFLSVLYFNLFLENSRSKLMLFIPC